RNASGLAGKAPARPEGCAAGWTEGGSRQHDVVAARDGSNLERVARIVLEGARRQSRGTLNRRGVLDGRQRRLAGGRDHARFLRFGLFLGRHLLGLLPQRLGGGGAAGSAAAIGVAAVIAVERIANPVEQPAVLVAARVASVVGLA